MAKKSKVRQTKKHGTWRATALAGDKYIRVKDSKSPKHPGCVVWVENSRVYIWFTPSGGTGKGASRSQGHLKVGMALYKKIRDCLNDRSKMGQTKGFDNGDMGLKRSILLQVKHVSLCFHARATEEPTSTSLC